MINFLVYFPNSRGFEERLSWKCQEWQIALLEEHATVYHIFHGGIYVEESYRSIWRGL